MGTELFCSAYLGKLSPARPHCCSSCSCSASSVGYVTLACYGLTVRRWPVAAIAVHILAFFWHIYLLLLPQPVSLSCCIIYFLIAYIIRSCAGWTLYVPVPSTRRLVLHVLRPLLDGTFVVCERSRPTRNDMTTALVRRALVAVGWYAGVVTCERTFQYNDVPPPLCILCHGVLDFC
jgi:hypothetical protein